MSLTRTVTFSAGGAELDRATHLRDDAQRLLWNHETQILPMWQGKPLIDVGEGWTKLAWLPAEKKVLEETKELPVFIGLFDDKPVFAADYSHLSQARIERRFIAGAKFIDLRSVAGEISAGEATVVATARAVIGWHQRHRFCAVCGAPSEIECGGWRRRCVSCDAQHFPRVDPVVIMLVIRRDRVLLGRQEAWPEGMFSLLAGYMEPGETIEDAVRRETMEEAGIKIGRVAYLACQPWPFPSNLMIGCLAEALDDEIAIDTQELEDARWVAKTELPDILAGKHMSMLAPRVDAIARTLISAWVSGEVEPFS